MPRIALFNMMIGFTVLLLSASGGTFIAYDMTEAFLKNNDQLNTWQMTLFRSAHGHFNLFGMVHILMGLTIPYSQLSVSLKSWQTGMMLAGTVAMGLAWFFEPTLVLPRVWTCYQ